jgi:hypothetical protein
MSGDPLQCRLHAANCLRAAESATNLETREEFIALAHIWLRRAAEFDLRVALTPKNYAFSHSPPKPLAVHL